MSDIDDYTNKTIKEINIKFRDYIVKHGCECITTELILLIICSFEEFISAYKSVGGKDEDLETLKSNLQAHIGKFAGQAKNPEDIHLSLNADWVFGMAQHYVEDIDGGRYRDIRIGHLLYSIYLLEDTYAFYCLNQLNINIPGLIHELGVECL